MLLLVVRQYRCTYEYAAFRALELLELQNVKRQISKMKLKRTKCYTRTAYGPSGLYKHRFQVSIHSIKNPRPVLKCLLRWRNAISSAWFTRYKYNYTITVDYKHPINARPPLWSICFWPWSFTSAPAWATPQLIFFSWTSPRIISFSKRAAAHTDVRTSLVLDSPGIESLNDRTKGIVREKYGEI